MQRHIDELTGHHIVCGLGDTGRHAVAELQKTNTPHVVVDLSEENLKKLKELHPEALREMLYVVGDATEEDILEKAGLSRAKGLIAALPLDKDNLVVTVIVRQRFPKMRIIARSAERKFSERMLRAGANSTVSPSHIGGLRMASEMLRPNVVSFLDLMLKEQSRTLRVEEVEVGGASAWVGKTLGQLDLRTAYNLLPMAVKRPAAAADSKYHVNPPDSLTIEKGMILIVIGEVKDLQRVRQEASA